MAGSQKYSETEYVLKKGGADVVDPCKGWFEVCEYCDKRFGEWVAVDEEIYEKIPEKPGFVMIALKNKNCTEVVSITYDQFNIQKSATTNITDVKDHISDKKSKASKSTILVRWMIIKKEGDKENTILCAHWYNNGILPKFLKSWPGEKFLQESEILELSKQLQKWCYLKKNPVWRKSKPPPSKTVEEVKKCNLQSCEICDEYFPPWRTLENVIADDLAPEQNGLVLFSAVTKKSREIVAIICDQHKIVVNIKSAVKQFELNRSFDSRDSKFKNANTKYEVRWMSPTDINSDNLCFLYAHWLNAERCPVFNYIMPGENILDKKRNFVLRNHDKKWLYEIEEFKQTKVSKEKNKRSIRELVNEEYLESESASD